MVTLQPAPVARRPLSSRAQPIFHRLSRVLVSMRMTPNQVSLASLAFAALAALAWLRGPHAWWLAAVAIQARLSCNLLDGLMAIEAQQATPLGVLYNDFPDRIADSMILIAAGYATPWPVLGWLAALGAVTTAYIRAFGGACGLPQNFQGPMAKPQRMAWLTGAALLLGVLPHAPDWLALVLFVINLGLALTCALRTRSIACALTLRSA